MAQRFPAPLSTTVRVRELSPGGIRRSFFFSASPSCAPLEGFDAFASDVWKYGVCVHTLAAGFLPWDHAGDLCRLFEVIAAEPYREPPGGWPHPELDALLRSLLNKDPTARPSPREVLRHPFVACGS